MAQNSKWFRVCSEGPSSDGRIIKPEWLVQMAKNYDPDYYGARVNMEHIKGLLPDGPFCRYGDVIGLKTEDFKGALTLFAQIDPTSDMVKMTTDQGQKVYPSVEIDPNFAGTGEAYLVALGLTDEPGSLRTEMIKFNAHNKFSRVKVAGEGVDWLEMWESEAVIQPESDQQPEHQMDEKTMLSRLFEFVLGENKAPQIPPKPAPPRPDATKDDDGDCISVLLRAQTKVINRQAAQDQALADLTKQFSAMRGQFETLLGVLEKTPADSQHSRPFSAGAGAGKTSASQFETDC